MIPSLKTGIVFLLIDKKKELYMQTFWGLSKTKLMEVELVCLRHVMEYISIFINPSHQGPNFSWVGIS
jgi:hypothetical protein